MKGRNIDAQEIKNGMGWSDDPVIVALFSGDLRTCRRLKALKG